MSVVPEASKRTSIHARKRLHRVGAVLLGLLMLALLAPAASAVDPSGIAFTLAGCRNGGGLSFPANGPFICGDTAYRTGNLGAGWDELDKVPFRVTTRSSAKASTTTFTFAIAVEYKRGGIAGYDILSAPELNAAKSDASCAVTPGSSTVTSDERTLYRLVTIAQARGTSCLLDLYARLAIGSSKYPGSSLHANLFNESLTASGVGRKDVSIPRASVVPQSLAKDMTATQDQQHTWSISKTPTPGTASFDLCNPAPYTTGVSVQISWTRNAATPSGLITVTTHVYATNPASTAVDIDVSDSIRSGTTELDSADGGWLTLPANVANQLVLTHTTTVPSGTTDINDLATAIYRDTGTQVPTSQTTSATATATVQPSGVTLNASATIGDVTSVTSHFSFSVDSSTGASGSFDKGYVAGTVADSSTLGGVSWLSGTQSGSGSVTFSQSVNAAGVNDTGSLDDTATLNGSDGFQTSANLSIPLAASDSSCD